MKRALKIVFAAALLIWLYRRGQLDFAAIFNLHQAPVYFGAVVFCCFIAIVAPIWRWWVLIRIQNLPLNFLDAVRLTMVANFFNVFIPGGSGGDLVRAVYITRDCPNNKIQSIIIAFVDRGMGVHALMLLGAMACTVNTSLIGMHPGFKTWLFLMFIILIIGTLFPFMCFNKRIITFLSGLFKLSRRRVDAWEEACRLFREKASQVAVVYLLSIVNVLFTMLAIHFAMKAVGGSPLISESLLFAPLIVLANMLPVSPGGIGVAESVSAALYAGVGQSAGATGMLLVRLFIIFGALAGLPFYLADKRRKPVQPHPGS